MARKYYDNSDTVSSESIRREKYTPKPRKHRDDDPSSEIKHKTQRKIHKTRKYRDDSSTEDRPKSQRKHKSYNTKKSRREGESSESHYVSQRDLEKLKRDRKVRELYERIEELELELSDQNYKYNKLKEELKNSEKANINIKTPPQTTIPEVIKEETPKIDVKQPEPNRKFTNNTKKKGTYNEKCCLDF